MERWTKWFYSLHDYLLSSVGGALLVLQIALVFFFDRSGIDLWRSLGYGIWALSAVFGWLPILALKMKGGVPKGKSYVHTSILVDSGLYAIVRHPQVGTAPLLMNLAVMLIAQDWLIAVLGAASGVLFYLDTWKADRRCIEKFGDDYGRYTRRVPRVNFLAGIARLARHRSKATDRDSTADVA